MTSDSAPGQRTDRLRSARDHLSSVLATLDLEAESGLADDVIEALRATDRAYQLENGSDQRMEIVRFVYPYSSDGHEPSLDR